MPPRKTLQLYDAINIIIGIVVGTSIFKAPSLVAQNCSSIWQMFGVWIVGGVLSLLGALCYAELTTTYKQAGGDYAYLNRAYGHWLGFIFGWGQLTVVITASIGSMAYVFADYASQLWDFGSYGIAIVACIAVIGLSVVNGLGIVVGKSTQNILTVAKVIGLIGIAIAGLVATPEIAAQATSTTPSTNIGLAMVFVLYTYGGWNDCAFVAAEVENRRRNLPLALIGGIIAITAIYLLINIVFVSALGFDGLRSSFTPAADVLHAAFGARGSQVMSVIVMISALGAMNGTMLTGSRVYAELGADHRILKWLGGWDVERRSPIRALIAQAVITIAMIFGVGTETGRNAIDAVLTSISLEAVPWTEYFGGFDTLVAASAPVFWAFFLLTGIGIVILRFKDRNIKRPFSIPLYPLPVIVFCGMCVYMLYSSIMYAKELALFMLLPVVVGGCLYLLQRRAPVASLTRSRGDAEDD